MNRLHAAASLAEASTRAPGRQKPQSILPSPTAPTGAAVFTPLHYEPDYAYPLLIWLHDHGNNEDQLKQVMPLISMRNYAAVAPRGTLPGGASAGSEANDRFRWSQQVYHIEQAEQRVLAAADQAIAQLNIHAQRVFLVGAGCGGTMAFRVAMRHPELFRGVISLGGPFPAGETPLARLTDARRLPLFVGTSRESQSYPEAAVCDDLRLFHTAGLSITLRQYPGRDQLHEMVLRDVDRWIMEVLANDQEISVVSS